MSVYPDTTPGQIWWADIPFETGSGHKDRPALILSTSRYHVEVLMFTSKDKSGRAGYLPMPGRVWAAPGLQSRLRVDRVIRIRRERIRRLEGSLDQATMNASLRAQRSGRGQQLAADSVAGRSARSRLSSPRDVTPGG
ncbi:MAG TPA: type II toxin-antitoxin system PemK/MazF family toxin [Pedococcus sp.]|nr:type II toxin-antitoxin system PemK/MazF family toxin [Pedococcus sp.]